MNKPGLDGRHRDKNGEISHKHGNTLVGTLRKIYGKGFAAGYPETTELSEVLLSSTRRRSASCAVITRPAIWNTRSARLRSRRLRPSGRVDEAPQATINKRTGDVGWQSDGKRAFWPQAFLKSLTTSMV